MEKLGGYHEVPFPVSIVFGERDWMDTRGSARIVMQNKFFAEGDSNLYILPSSGHQMAIDQPEALSKLLIKDITGQSKKVFMPAPPTIRYLNAKGQDLQEHEWDQYLIDSTAISQQVWNKVEEIESYRTPVQRGLSGLETEEAEQADRKSVV